MTTELIKTVYLCSGVRPAIEVIDSDSRRTGITSTINGLEAEYVIPLAPVGSQDEIGVNVVMGMLKNGGSWADKYKPEIKLTLASDNAVAPYWINGVILDFDIPPGCDWQQSTLIPNLTGNTLGYIDAPANPGEIPDSKSDVSMVTIWDGAINSNVAIPGDRIDAHHLYRVAQQVNVGPVRFHTEHFTGGKVVARRAHPAIPNLLSYDVECEGQTLTDILPTDYYLYNIGDDVFPFTVGDSRTTLSPSFPSGSFRMAPLKLGGRGAAYAVALSFSSFTEYANLRVLVGSVVSVLEPPAVLASENKAVVLINGVNYTLDIIYHCASQSIADGKTAFIAGDAVLVLWSGYKNSLSALDMLVIGHVGYVYPCTTTTTTTTTTSTTTTSTTTTTAPPSSHITATGTLPFTTQAGMEGDIAALAYSMGYTVGPYTSSGDLDGYPSGSYETIRYYKVYGAYPFIKFAGTYNWESGVDMYWAWNEYDFY